MWGGLFLNAWAFVLTILVPFFYHFILEIARPSPLSPLNLDTLIQTSLAAAQIGVFAGVTLALIATLLGCLICFIRPSQGQLPRWGMFGLTVVLLTVGLLPAVENFFYIIVGQSLKTSDDFGRKLLIGVIAFVLAGAFVRPLLRLAEQLTRSRILGTLLLLTYGASFATTAAAVARNLDDRNSAADLARYNVLIVSSDGVDATRMSVYDYEKETTPFLEKISSEFLIFRNAFTNNGNTTGSVTALFTGRSPLTTRVVYPPDILVGKDAVMHLPSLLGTYGYYRSNWGVPHYADSTSQNWIDAFDSNVGVNTYRNISSALPMNDDGVAGWFVRRTLADIQSLTLDVLNIEEAANPYEQITGGANTLSDDQRLEGVLFDITRNTRFFTHVHFMNTHGPMFWPQSRVFSTGMEQTEKYQSEFLDDAIRDFDAQVERIYAGLKQLGKLENTILIITSDHGMRSDETRRIPLMMRLPSKLRTGLIHENVQRIDVAPTILTLLQIPVPDWMEGQNLLDPVPPDRIFLATRTTSASQREDGYWIRGKESNFSDIRITVISCDTYFVFTLPLRVIKSDRIQGSSSPCKQDDRLAFRTVASRVVADAVKDF